MSGIRDVGIRPQDGSSKRKWSVRFVWYFSAHLGWKKKTIARLPLSVFLDDAWFALGRQNESKFLWS